MRETSLLILLAACGGLAGPPPASSPAAPAGSAVPSCDPAPGQIALFEHADYDGRCVTLGAGDYAFPADMLLENDTVSSIFVRQGARALLCTAHGFTGECTYVDRDTPALASNDTLSSIRVEAQPADCVPGPGQIALYEHPSWTGACTVLGIGDFARSPQLGLANDTASSVRVGPGAQALVCAHDDWGEPCVPVRDARHELGALDDAISSVRVLRSGADCIVRAARDGKEQHIDAMQTFCSDAYPEILELLATHAVFSPPLTVTWEHLPHFAAEARGRDVFLDERAIDPNDMRVLYHELTHIITKYPDAPLWVSEGIADFVLAELSGWNEVHCSDAQTYLGGYRCAAVMLGYIEKQHPGAMKRMHATLRTEAFDGLIAGRTPLAWWDDCTAAGPCRPR